MALSPDIIETMLTQLKENQEELKKDYNSRIDKLEIKIESMFEKIEKKFDFMRSNNRLEVLFHFLVNGKQFTTYNLVD